MKSSKVVLTPALTVLGLAFVLVLLNTATTKPATAGGTVTSASWTTEGNQDHANLGVSVSTAGDVNGDGYSDVFVAPAPQHPRSLPRSISRQLLCGPGLADAGLANDYDEASVAVDGVVECSAKLAKLPLATYEGSTNQTASRTDRFILVLG